MLLANQIFDVVLDLNFGPFGPSEAYESILYFDRASRISVVAHDSCVICTAFVDGNQDLRA